MTREELVRGITNAIALLRDKPNMISGQSCGVLMYGTDVAMWQGLLNDLRLGEVVRKELQSKPARNSMGLEIWSVEARDLLGEGNDWQHLFEALSDVLAAEESRGKP